MAECGRAGERSMDGMDDSMGGQWALMDVKWWELNKKVLGLAATEYGMAGACSGDDNLP